MARYPEDVQLEALWQATPCGEKDNLEETGTVRVDASELLHQP